MASKPRSVAVYARISSDQEGTGLGVNRQLDDCRRLVADLGWTLAEEYVDNDLSAYSGKRRPSYQRMLTALAEGTRDAVVAYHVDRLTRRPIELEQFLETVTAAGVRHVRFASGGDLDPGSGDGLLVMRMLSAVAANESATKSRRVLRKMDEVAASGRPHGGSNRPFGYEADRITVRESEAKIVRAMVDRFLAGESLRSLCMWLDAEGIPTATGATWHSQSLRQVISSPRIAGLRSHRGQVVGPAIWKPIISEAQRTRVLAFIEQKRLTNRRTPRTYLLTGLLRCGRCDGRLYSSAHSNRRRYVCLSGPDHGGCGRITVTAPPLEELITDAVLYRLDTPELADALSGRSTTDEVHAAIADELTDDRRLLDELAGLYAAKAVTAQEWISARNPIQARIDNAVRQLARSTGSDALVGLVGNGEQLRTQWTDLPLSRRNAVIAAVLDQAFIDPGSPTARTLDPERVRPLWRL